MDIKKPNRTISRVEQSIGAGAKRFFAMEDDPISMPRWQSALFLEKAYAEHLLVAVRLGSHDVATGYVQHKLSSNTYLLQSWQSNVAQIIRLQQCEFVQRLTEQELEAAQA
ncbi:hypothetical protein [Lacticaseibacillus zhaodongensis]|uniref:hypothetical protein n=1 Tax=Lacticaseibacillus zhaodongensis TaxID=2668065 RepID=UPI0012D2F906|nr:hypothetical protein [Lacticaseibacillus zhaodongensis]